MKNKDPEKKKPTIGFAEKLGFMSFSAASNIVTNFKNTYYKYFLTSILLINPLAVSNMMLIGTIWDIVNDPLLGVWANNIRFRSGEKVRPWLLWMAFPYAIGMMFLFYNFGLGEKGNIIMGVIVFFLYEIANTFRGIPYNGMGSLVSSDDGDRKSINGFRSLGVVIGTGLGAVAVPMVVKAFGGLRDHSVINSTDSTPIFKTACFMGVLIAAGCLLHYFTTKERVKQVSGEEKPVGILETYRMLFKCKSWVRNMLYVMFYGATVCLSTSAITYHSAYVLNNSSLAAPIMLFYLIASLIFSVITPKIDSLIGRKKTLIFAGIMLVAGKIPTIFYPASVPCVILNCLTSGIGLTITFIVMNTNRNNISDIVELQNGRRLDTMVSTGDGLMSKVAEAFTDKLSLLALAAAGFNAALAEEGKLQNAATQNTINAFISWIPMLFGLAMTVIALSIDTRKEYEEAAAQAGKKTE